MKLLFGIALLFVCVLSQEPPRPKLSEVFEAKVRVEIRRDHVSYWGNGAYIVDQPAGKGLERYHFEGHPELNHHYLQRYDMHRTFVIGSPTNASECTTHEVEGPMPAIWEWIEHANYTGQRHLHNNVYDVWEFTAGYATMWIAVSPSDVNRPAFVGRRSEQREFNLVFDEWHIYTPNPNVFAVPHGCPANSDPIPEPSVGCLSRSTMISRGEKWVKAHVPYNQHGTHDGYREDCSGFVSMCWELSKPGLTTSTLPSVSHKIKKGDLKPGDVLLNVHEHVVLFKGWTDSKHTHYTAMEETRPGEGTVERVTPYPYWYNQAAFVPYRYKNAC